MKQMRIITKEESEIILENLKSFNGNKPIGLLKVLNNIENRICNKNINSEEMRLIAMIYSHFGLYREHLPYELQGRLAIYGELPKNISEIEIRKYLANRQF